MGAMDFELKMTPETKPLLRRHTTLGEDNHPLRVWYKGKVDAKHCIFLLR